MIGFSTSRIRSILGELKIMDNYQANFRCYKTRAVISNVSATQYLDKARQPDNILGIFSCFPYSYLKGILKNHRFFRHYFCIQECFLNFASCWLWYFSASLCDTRPQLYVNRTVFFFKTNMKSTLVKTDFRYIILCSIPVNYRTVCAYCKQNNCPRRDFAQKAKSRGGTLVTRAYIKGNAYS